MPIEPTPKGGTSYNEYTTPVSQSTLTSEEEKAVEDMTTETQARNVNVDYPVSGNLYSSDASYQPNGQITTDYASQVSYSRREGRYVYPVAGTDTTGSQAGVIVQEHCPIEVATISWMVVSSVGLPRIPSPNLADTNFILIDRQIDNAVPVIGLSGNIRRYVIAGTYTYQMVRPGSVVRDFPGLGNVLDKTPRSANTIPASKFDASLVF